jgi:hypothetical protein
MVDARTLLRLALGVALVAVPLWAPALSLAGTDYGYRAVELTTANGTLEPAYTVPARPGLDGIDCFAGTAEDRDCVDEAALRDGNRTVAYPRLQGARPGDFRFPGDRYVAFGPGPVYERTAAFDERGRIVLGLEPTDAVAALDAVAVRPSRVPAPARRAVARAPAAEVDVPATAPAWADNRLGDLPPVVVSGSDTEQRRYYRVYRSDVRRRLPTDPGVAAVGEALAVLVGAALLATARPGCLSTRS